MLSMSYVIERDINIEILIAQEIHILVIGDAFGAAPRGMLEVAISR